MQGMLLAAWLASLAVLQTPATTDPAIAGWIAKLGTPEKEDAIAALVAAGRPAIPALIDVLETDVREDAWQATRALRKFGPKADFAKSRLATVFRNEKLPGWRRGLAALALGSMPAAAATSVDALVAALRENSNPDLQVLSACALVGIGEPSGPALGKELANKDLGTCLWSANLLVDLGAKAAKAKPDLQKLGRLDPKAGAPLLFLLEPSMIAVSNAIGIPRERAKTVNDYIREMRSNDPKHFGSLELMYYGGVLPPEMMNQPAMVREFLASSFGLGKDDAAFAIALPETFADSDRNNEFNVGELVQGIGNHLAPALRRVREPLEADAIRSWNQWDEASAPLRGLVLAIHVLTRPEFLEKSRCLEPSSRFEGLYSRVAK